MSKFMDLWSADQHPSTRTRQLQPVPSVISFPGRRADWNLTRDETDFQRAAAILRKHWRASAAFAGSVLAIATLITLLTSPVYEPAGRMQIDPPGAEVFSLQAGQNVSTDSEYIATEAQKLRTDDLAIATIRALHLDANPEFSRPPRGTGSGNWGANLSPTENAALHAYHRNLTVQRDPGSRLIVVKFGSHDPRLAASIVNTLMTLFIEHNYQARHGAILQSSEWLSKQLDDVRAKKEQADRALTEFQRENGITQLDDQTNTYAEQMTDLNKQVAEAQASRIQLQSFVRHLNNSSPDSLPQVRSSPVIQALTQKLAEVRAELSQTRVIYGPNHPNSKKLENQSAELERQIRSQRAAIISELKTSYEAARAREQMLESQMQSTTKEASKLAQYNALRKEAKAQGDLYNELYAKIKEAAIAAASKSSNIHIVDQARVLDSPTRPNRRLNLLIAFLLAVVGGVTMAFVKEGIEDSVRNVDDVRKWTGMSSIAIVPSMEAAGPRTFAFRPQRALPGKVAMVPLPPELFLIERPSSPEAEAMRSLRTSVLLSRPGNPPQMLLVVSPSPREGKTTVASNLAIGLAQYGRTCLVDADLRCPGVSRVFRISPQLGVANVLDGSADLEAALITSRRVPNLSILCAAAAGSVPSPLGCSEVMHDLLDRLRAMFDFIVIDTPPILPYAEARALSPFVDGVILVSRVGSTPRKTLSRSLELLAEVHSAPILEIVLNGADHRTEEYRYYKAGR